MWVVAGDAILKRDSLERNSFPRALTEREVCPNLSGVFRWQMSDAALEKGDGSVSTDFVLPSPANRH